MENESHLLAPEIMENIFGRLSFDDLKSVRLASRSMKKSVDTTLEYGYKQLTIERIFPSLLLFVESNVGTKIAALLPSRFVNGIPIDEVRVTIEGRMRLIDREYEFRGPVTFSIEVIPFTSLVNGPLNRRENILIHAYFSNNKLTGVATSLYTGRQEEDDVYIGMLNGQRKVTITRDELRVTEQMSTNPTLIYTWIDTHYDLYLDVQEFIDLYSFLLNPTREQLSSFIEERRSYTMLYVQYRNRYTFNFFLTSLTQEQEQEEDKVKSGKGIKDNGRELDLYLLNLNDYRDKEDRKLSYEYSFSEKQISRQEMIDLYQRSYDVLHLGNYHFIFNSNGGNINSYIKEIEPNLIVLITFVEEDE